MTRSWSRVCYCDTNFRWNWFLFGMRSWGRNPSDVWSVSLISAKCLLSLLKAETERNYNSSVLQLSTIIVIFSLFVPRRLKLIAVKIIWLDQNSPRNVHFIRLHFKLKSNYDLICIGINARNINKSNFYRLP